VILSKFKLSLDFKLSNSTLEGGHMLFELLERNINLLLAFGVVVVIATCVITYDWKPKR